MLGRCCQLEETRLPLIDQRSDRMWQLRSRTVSQKAECLHRTHSQRSSPQLHQLTHRCTRCDPARPCCATTPHPHAIPAALQPSLPETPGQKSPHSGRRDQTSASAERGPPLRCCCRLQPCNHPPQLGGCNFPSESQGLRLQAGQITGGSWGGLKELGMGKSCARH